MPSYAATIPTVQSVTLNATGANQPGSTVTLTAHGSASSGSVLYDFWVQEPNGQWKNVQPWSSQATYKMPNIQNGSYLVVVSALTPAQIRDHDWTAAVNAQQTINVGTTVTVTGITNALTSGGVTAGHPVTITAQAQNITNPVYQFWIEQNGQWTGTNYTSQNTYTFTPKTAQFETAVYAKTVEEPTNAGTNLGITPATATTPKMFALNTANAQAQSTVLSILNGYSFFKGSNGIAMLSRLPGAPSASIVDPLIPASLPPNGSITGAAALLQTNPDLLTQAQVIAQSHGVTVTPQVLEAGMHMAGRALMDYFGNDPATLTSVMEPGLLSPLPAPGTQVAPAVQNLLNDYWGGYSMETTHNYAYNQSVMIQKTTTYPTMSVAKPQYSVPANLPQRIVDLTVPMTYTEVMNYQQPGDPNNVEVTTMQAQVTVDLFHDPLVSGGLQWGFGGFKNKMISSPIIWPAS